MDWRWMVQKSYRATLRKTIFFETSTLKSYIYVNKVGILQEKVLNLQLQIYKYKVEIQKVCKTSAIGTCIMNAYTQIVG